VASVAAGAWGSAIRYQDLALAWVKAFFELYGVEPDEQRIKFYCLLDEFF
jgi:aminoglycoside 3'-phosphotransferase-2